MKDIFKHAKTQTHNFSTYFLKKFPGITLKQNKE